MAMGRREKQRQQKLWVETRALAEAPRHPICERLAEIQEKHDFDSFVEERCQAFYDEKIGPPFAAASGLLPAAPDRIFRGHRLRAWHRLASGRFDLASRLPRLRALGRDAEPFDDLAHSAAGRRGDARFDVDLGLTCLLGETHMVIHMHFAMR